MFKDKHNAVIINNLATYKGKMFLMIINSPLSPLSTLSPFSPFSLLSPSLPSLSLVDFLSFFFFFLSDLLPCIRYLISFLSFKLS